MKTLTVAFVGRKHDKDYWGTIKKIKKVVSELIEEEDADTFLFGANGLFGDLGHMAVTELKEKAYPLIKRVYICGAQEKDKPNETAASASFEDCIYPYGAKEGKYSTGGSRSRVMIDMCDVVMLYCPVDYRLMCRNDTKCIIEYAVKQNKRIINLFDIE